MGKITILLFSTCIACFIMSSGYGFWEKELKIIGSVEIIPPEIEVDIAALPENEILSSESNEIGTDILMTKDESQENVKQSNEKEPSENQDIQENTEPLNNQNSLENEANNDTPDPTIEKIEPEVDKGTEDSIKENETDTSNISKESENNENDGLQDTNTQDLENNIQEETENNNQEEVFIEDSPEEANIENAE